MQSNIGAQVQNETRRQCVIKKYGNRRLYDTADSRYVNLDDIAGFIREGRDVQVVDAKTGKDLTRVTLTQIITEDAKDKPTGLPLELLRQLVVASDEVRQEFIMWYLKSAFDAYQKVQDAVQSRLGDVQSAILSPVDMMKKFLGAAPAHLPLKQANWKCFVGRSPTWRRVLEKKHPQSAKRRWLDNAQVLRRPDVCRRHAQVGPAVVRRSKPSLGGTTRCAQQCRKESPHKKITRLCWKMQHSGVPRVHLRYSCERIVVPHES